MPYASNCPRCQQAVTIPPTSTENFVVQCPLCLERFDLSEALDFVAEIEGEAPPPPLIVVGAGPEPEFRLQVGDKARPPEPAAAFEFGAPVGADRGSGAGARRGAEKRRPRRDRGGLKDLVGAILGGAAGLLITYYVLNLIGGQRFDFLRMYLPGVKHTAAHRPDWLGGPPEQRGDGSDAGVGEGIGNAAETSPPGQTPPFAADGGVGSRAGEGDPATAGGLPASGAGLLPPDYVGLIQPPEITPDDFGAALKAVGDAMKAGSLNEEGYAAWCRLAEAATFVDRSGGGPQMHNRFEAVRRLLRDLDTEDLAKAGQWAGERLKESSEAPSGILVAGTANMPNTQRGNTYLMELLVAGTGQRVVVASSATLPAVQDDRLVLLGQIVNRPKEAIQGFDIELPQVVWSGLVLKCYK